MFSASVSNKLYNRSYPFSFNVSAAQTWEYHTVTIPGDFDEHMEKPISRSLVLQFAVASAGNAVRVRQLDTHGYAKFAELSRCPRHRQLLRRDK